MVNHLVRGFARRLGNTTLNRGLGVIHGSSNLHPRSNKQIRRFMKREDRVEKRGLGHLGTVIDVKDDWVSVKWDDGQKARERPLICLKRELRPL